MKFYKNYSVYLLSLIFISFTLFLLTTNGIAQNIDSLEQLISSKKGLDKAKGLNELASAYKEISFSKSYQYANQALILSKNLANKTEEANALHILGVLYYFKGDFDKTLEYWQKAFFIRQEGNDQIGVGNSLNNLGLVYFKKGDYSKAMDCYNKSLSLQTQLKNKKGIANSLENIGLVYSNYGIYKKAIEFYQQSLKIEEELGNKLGVSQSFNSIADVYFQMNNFEKALEYYSKSLSIKEQLGNKQEVAIALNNIGNVYDNQNNLEKAIEYYEKSLILAKETEMTECIGNLYNNLGNIFIKQNNLPKALSLIQNAIKIHQKSGNKKGIASSFSHFSDIYNLQNNKELALDCSLKSLAIAKEIGIRDQIKRNYLLQSEIYAKQKNYEKAFETHQKYVDIKDSLFNEESYKQISKIEVEYQIEEKKKEIAFLNQQSELNSLKIKKNEKDIQFQRIINYVILIGFIFILLFALLLYRQYLAKKEINLKLEIQNKEIQIQRNIAIQQRDQITEQKKHITDSILYAKKIQSAILPFKAYIKNIIPETFVLFEPKDIVSGDFYWFSKAPENENIIFVAAIDCTGHGVPGAFMSIVGYNLLNQAINQQNLSKPSDILNAMTKGLYETLQLSDNDNIVKDSMDISLCAINTQNLTLEYAGANNPVYIIRKNELIELKADKYSIGDPFNANFGGYENKEYLLEENDTIYLFSDGYIDQFGGTKRKKFLSRQFKKVLLDIHTLSMDNQKQRLEEIFHNWKGDIEQYDDIMVIGLKIQDINTMKEKVLLNYKGIYHFETIETLINQAKNAIALIEVKNVVKKKIINVLIECLENIHKYGIIDNDCADILPEIRLVQKEKQFCITTKNLIGIEQSTELTNHLETVNKLNREGLQKLYEEVINNGNLSEKGGAGLGIIDMALKSGNPLKYSFIPFNKQTIFFELIININDITV
ncbi:MAG: SiaB family protein kinase [Bacteroidales bacterium]